MKYEHIVAVFDAFDSLIETGVVENLLFKVLDHLLNVYASDVHAGRPIPISRAARSLLGVPGAVILEHGTPRRELTRLFVTAHRRNKLSKAHARNLIEKHWAIAYITKAEDQRLRDLGLRSKMMDSPQARWAAAGIEFTDEIGMYISDEISKAAQSNIKEIIGEPGSTSIGRYVGKATEEVGVKPKQSEPAGVTNQMTAYEFQHRYGGNPASIRNQIVEYLFQKLGFPSTIDEIAETIGRTSHFGPGKGEVCTASHVRSALHHIKRRLEKRGLPFAVRENGRDIIALVHTG